MLTNMDGHSFKQLNKQTCKLCRQNTPGAVALKSGCVFVFLSVDGFLSVDDASIRLDVDPIDFFGDDD